MTINQLEYYCTLVEQKNFTRAAEQLHVSQSTISKSIRALEEEFDVTLIEHSSKTFRLSEEGKIFYEGAKEMLEHYQKKMLELQERLKSKRGSLSVGIPPVTITAFFSPVIYQYRYKYPDVHLSIVETGANTVRDLVKDGTIDIGAIILPFEDERFVIHPVMQSEAVLLVSDEHPLAKEKSVRFAQLKDEKFMILTSDYMLHDLIIRKCQAAGFTPYIGYESAQWDLLVEMVSMNQGISILPRPIIDKFWSPHVKEIHLTEPDFPWVITMIYRKDKFITAPMRYFMDMVDVVAGIGRTSEQR